MPPPDGIAICQGGDLVLSQTFRGGRPLYYCWMRIQWGGTMIEFKGSHFEREVILRGVRWYVAYPISYRQLEEMLEERGVEVDHSTLNRWVEPPRVCRRPQLLGGWGHGNEQEAVEQIFT